MGLGGVGLGGLLVGLGLKLVSATRLRSHGWCWAAGLWCWLRLELRLAGVAGWAGPEPSLRHVRQAWPPGGHAFQDKKASALGPFGAEANLYGTWGDSFHDFASCETDV